MQLANMPLRSPTLHYRAYPVIGLVTVVYQSDRAALSVSIVKRNQFNKTVEFS